MKRRTFLTQLVTLSAALSLPACGFHPRGSQAIPYRSIYLDGGKNGSNFTYEGGLASSGKESIKPRLEQALLDRGIKIAATRNEADAVLEIQDEKLTRTILSLSGGGRVTEFRLGYSLSYSLTGKDGREIFPLSTIQSAHDFTYDDNLYLAKSAEESFLYHDQLDAAVQQIMRRLAKPR